VYRPINCEVYNYTMSEKTCQLILCSVLVKHEPISIKIGRHVLVKALNKSM